MNDPTQLPLATLVGRVAQLQEVVRAALAAGDAGGALAAETEREQLISALFESSYGLSSAELTEFATTLLQVQNQLAAEVTRTRARLEGEASQLRSAGRGASTYLATAGMALAGDTGAGR